MPDEEIESYEWQSFHSTDQDVLNDLIIIYRCIHCNHPYYEAVMTIYEHAPNFTFIESKA